jgi:hypothetical protein
MEVDMKKVILISGKIHRGKNQFAEYLNEELIKKNLKVSSDLFARSLKDGCKEDFRKLTNVLDNISEEIKTKINLWIDQRQLILHGDAIVKDLEKSINKLIIKDENWYENKTDITRNILQLYGTEIFRKRVDENWWVKQVKNRCIASNDDIIIVTDCRFPNEITEMLCDDYETITIRINRNINTNEQTDFHDSETALDNWQCWDYIVDNNSNLIELRGSATVIANELTEVKEEDYDGLFTRVSKENLKILSNII